MHLILLIQGYSSNSKDRKGNFLDDWDLSEAGGAEASEVDSPSCASILSGFYFFSKNNLERN